MASTTEKLVGIGALILAFFGLRGNLGKAKTALDKIVTPNIVVRNPSGNRSIAFNAENFVPPNTISLREIYEKWGQRYGVDPDLIQAIARIESNENPSAVNPLDPSTGLMQILCRASCQTCQCQNRFNVIGWETATPERLFDPDFNVSIGTQIIAWNLETYGFLKGIAVYNRWASRNDPPNGPFGNQSYVDKVTREFNNLRGPVDFT